MNKLEVEANNPGTGLEIAVIGMAGRFPGAKTIDEFWENLKNGVESISFFSDEELKEAGIDETLLIDPLYVRAKGVLEDMEYFDHSFFNYSPKEAEIMDPQFRILHECAWHALEDAGYDPHVYTGAIGLYVGCLSNYQWVSGLLSQISNQSEQTIIGSLNDRDFLSTRVAYKLNLRGPAVNVQTACSTSLVAICMACQGLLSGESDMVLAGGVSIWLPKKGGYLYEKGMVRSPDGHCRAFDAEAQGTNGGDGVALVVLKRLEDALEDGDNIYAVVKGSATNNDGRRKVGYTAPSVEGQVEVIRAALQMAEAAPESITYVEAHGTGTALGDPIEVEALKRAFGSNNQHFCGIGSVKTNVGHLDAVAGVAGFIKTVLALSHRLIPPSLYFKTPNPGIDFQNTSFYVNTKSKEWKSDGYPLRAGVSSFGLGGTNAHVILEEKPDIGMGEVSSSSREQKLVLLSAKTPSALERATENLANYFKTHPHINLTDAVYTLQVGRKAFEYRCMVVVSEVNEAIPILSSPGSEKLASAFVSEGNPPLIFMFSGQGTQYVNMGLDLYREEPAFAQEINHCFNMLESITGSNMKGILYPDTQPNPSEGLDESSGSDQEPVTSTEKIHQLTYTLPIKFIFDYSLARLLMRWGVQPHAMIGHSFGEYVAACLSGILSLEDALKLVAARGRLMQQMEEGAMMNVPLSEAELQPYLNNELSLAAVNEPSLCIVSGPPHAIDMLENQLIEKGCECMRLRVPRAYHSQMVTPILEEFKKELAPITFNEPQIPYISGLSGTWITVEEAADTDYWVRHMQETVRFSDGLEELFKEPHAVFVEVGSGRGLSLFVSRHPGRGSQHRTLNLLRHRKEEISDVSFLLDKIGRLWLLGVTIDWQAFYSEEKRCRVPLPLYPFDRFYFNVDISDRLKVQSKPVEPLPQQWAEKRDAVSAGETFYESYTSVGDPVEERTIEILREVLGLENIRLENDFFQLGGDSLTAVMAASKISKAFHIEFPLTNILNGSTIREMAALIKGMGFYDYKDIRPVEKRDYYPQSSAQKRLFFLDQFESIGTSYNMPYAQKIEGKLETDRLQNVFHQLIQRHETLRTSFHMIEETPVQRIHPEVGFEIEYYDLAANTREDREAGLNPIKIQFSKQKQSRSDLPTAYCLLPTIAAFTRPFNLSHPPLLRVGLVKISEEEHVLLLCTHHIISDGTSMGNLVREFTGLYNREELSPLKIQYKDFSQWQNHLFESGRIEVQEKYWLDLYSGEIPLLNLPTDYPRPGIFNFRGDRYGFKLGREETLRFREMAKANNATLYMNLLTAFNVLLYRYTAQDDIIVGSGIAGRRHVDLQELIGLFVNMLAIRNDPRGDKTYTEFLKEVKEASTRAFENQDLQFEDLVDKLRLPRDPSRNPLFDVVFVVQNFDVPELETREVAFSPFEIENKTSKFDLSLYAFEKENDGEIEFLLEYCIGLFAQKTIQQMADHFITIIQQVLKNPFAALSDIDILSVEEKQQLLDGFNNTATSYPRDKTIHQLFEQQAAAAPDHIAVMGIGYNGESHSHALRNRSSVGVHPTYEVSDNHVMSVTYGELEKKANRIANYLYFGRNIRPDEPVGLLMDRSIELIAAILGILNAGGAYVPLALDLPHERIKTIINDANIGVMISQKRFIKTLNRLQWECQSLHTFICMDTWDIYSEEEVEKSELMGRKLWEYVGETAVDEITGGGWLSSYTGDPIPKEEMDEYGDNILKKLTPLLHKEMRVLEIGCASGITMYRIAPHVALYYGTDLSGAIIKKNEERAKKQGHRNIKLACMPAHEIDTIDERDFDLVIINSVIQCFHGHNYLRRVLWKAVDLLGDRGHLFIGDIMDQELKRDLIQDLVKFKQSHQDKEHKTKTKTDWSEELFVSRGFFEDLAIEDPRIEKVEFSRKIYTIKNELTEYRYDTLIQVDKTREPIDTASTKQKYQHDRSTLGKYGTGTVASDVSSSNLAYIIYTSGSTGTPKGTLTTHANVVRVVKDTNYIDLTENDRVLQLSNYAFDGSVFDIYGALLNGSTLVMIREEDVPAVNRLSEIIAAQGITLFFVTTALFNALVDIDIQSLAGTRKVLFGGERVSTAHAVRALEYLGKQRIIHVYGPTETTVYATYYHIDRVDARMETIPIGQPISNTFVYILDQFLKPVPMGVIGEIAIGGEGVARGYLNNPDLSNSKFQIPNSMLLCEVAPLRSTRQIPNSKFQITKSPTHPFTHSPIYRTGDLARWLPDGNIEFQGRIDHQVKIRGFRIELGEIENQLLKNDEIKEAVVVVREVSGENEAGCENRDRYLCAYIVPHGHSSSGVDISGLKDYLSGELPGYMIPSFFVILEELPLNPNGKVDKKALPAPDILGDKMEVLAVPENETQAQLAEIWSEVLGIDKRKIGIDSNFFELGGHSLKATLLVSKLHKKLEVKLPLAEVFRTPTIKELADFILNASKNIYESIEPAPAGMDYYPQSSAQQRLFFLDRLEGIGAGYNMPGVVQLEGELEIEKLEHTLKRLVMRHESLRTSFHMIDGNPIQKIHKEVNFKIKDYIPGGTGGLASLFVHPSAVTQIIETFIRPFDLSKAPLLRVGLIRRSENIHILMIDMHHIISDGISIGLFVKEFMALYGGKELPGLRIQYKDFSWWQKKIRESKQGKESVERQKAYWLHAFSQEVPVLSLPTDYPRPRVQSFEGVTIGFVIGEEETSVVGELALREEASLFMVLLAIYNVLLLKLTGQEDIVVGSPVAGRRHADLEPIIGMFVNTMALRNFPKADQPFINFLREVRERTLPAFENQEYPFEELVENVAIRRDASRNPLFDVVFVLQNMDISEVEIPGLKLRPYGFESKIAKFDMTLQAVEVGDTISFTLEYCTKLFKKETVERFIRYFKKIVSSVKENSLKKIRDIELFSQEEKEALLYGFNNTDAAFPQDKTIHLLFEEQVKRTPNYIAVVGAAGQHLAYMTYRTYMTYKELNKKSNQLAHELTEKGLKPGGIVGIMANRFIEIIVGILGILKAGGAYLPIDPEYPEERIRYMIADSNAKFLLTDCKDNIPVGTGGLAPLYLPFADHPVTNYRNPQLATSSENIAYVIYTSGTTGQPKGTLIQHRNVVRLMTNEKFSFDFGQRDVWTLFHSYCFDFSVWEMYGALLYGGKLVVIPRMIAQDTEQFLDLLIQDKVTVLNQTPSAFHRLVNAELIRSGKKLSLRYVIFGGEALNPGKLKQWKERYPRTTLVNMYGITETTVHVTYKAIGEQEIKSSISNIGQPIPTLTTYVMDKHLNLQPIGVAGELCVGGEGVGRGYLNRPSLTAEKFVENPCKPDERLYRSGDLARIFANGEMEYLGRVDQQVKIRGFRIELGEIETQLLKREEIKETVVVAKEDGTGDKYLCAYIVPHRIDSPYSTNELKKYLSRSLPDYMIPSYFVWIERIPLTPNGKIDKKALPEPGAAVPGAAYAPPTNRQEEILAQIWSELLGIDRERIGIDDNFFELGGHSLKATGMVSEIQKALNVRIPLTEIFTSPSIRQLSIHLKGADIGPYASLERVEEREYYPLSSAQMRLYVLQQMESGGISYNMPTVVEVEGNLEKEKLEQALQQLIKRHESLRTSFQMIDARPVQRIHKDVEFKIDLYDFRRTQDEVKRRSASPLTSPKEQHGDRHSKLATGIIERFIHLFDLSRDPLLRIGLIRTGENTHVLMVDMHHIISDGVSTGIFIKELTALYGGEKLPTLRIQYRDFSQWQKQQRDDGILKKQEAFWLSVFPGEIPVLNLPIDYVRPAIMDFEGYVKDFLLEEKETQAVKELAIKEGTTLYMVVLALFHVLLSKMSGQEDIVIGSPVAGRRHADLEPVMGMFVNTLALRNDAVAEKSFQDFLEDVKAMTLAALENQEYPFETLVENTAVARDAGRNPIFDVMFALQDLGSPAEDILGLKLRPVKYRSKISKFDLTLMAVEEENRIRFTFEYREKLFKEETIERFAGYFKRLISSTIEDPGKRLLELEITGEAEKKQVLYDFNNTRIPYPEQMTLHELFEEQVGRTPNHIAVVGIEGQHLTYRTYRTYMTYKELNKKSNQLAHLLREKGVEPGTIVGLMVDRSIEMIVGIMGTDQNLNDQNKRIPTIVLNFEHLNFDIVSDFDIRASNLDPSGLCYIIYTSGSTGRPKGVLTTHYNVTRVVRNTNYIELTEDDRILQLSNYAFDGSVFDIYGALLNGAVLVLLSGEKAASLDHLEEVIKKETITVFFVTTALFNLMVDEAPGIFEHIRKVLFGGERVSIDHTRRALKYAGKDKVIHVYGPTETTVYATYYFVETIAENVYTIPIGSPLSNTTAYILDRHLKPLPIGVVGELHIGGFGTARGYLNNPELSNSKFQIPNYKQIPNPKLQITKSPTHLTHPLTHSPIYRTGDLTRWLPDGNIEFLGRMDNQVKIRGFRIEPGEIEARLLNHEKIKEALVMVRHITGGNGRGENKEDKSICAYIVPARELELTVEEVREYLARHLPDYMVPSYFVFLEEIPLTSNGKVDYKTLPMPKFNVGDERVPPGSDIEKKLAEIWAEVLGIESHVIGIDSNFFELGGHSLKATILTAKIHKHLKVKLPLAEMFRIPTIRELANHINLNMKALIPDEFSNIEPAEQKDYYPLSSAQRRFYVLEQIEANRTGYNMPAVLIVEGKIHRQRMENVFRTLIQRHESLRTSFHLIEGEPVQKTHKKVSFQLEYGNVSNSPTSYLLPLVSQFIRPFDLSQAPLLRVSLVKIEEKKYLFMVDMHHIISDGTSTSILIKEFTDLYAGEGLPDLRIQYKDFSQWQHERLKSGQLKKQEAYWLDRFSNELPVLRMPTDFFRPAVQSFEGDRLEFRLEEALELELKRLMTHTGTTLFMVLMAVYNVLLNRYTGQAEIIVGTTTAGRNHADLEHIIGLLLETLAIRNGLEDEQVFEAFLQHVKTNVLEAFENQAYPFRELQKKVADETDLSRNPLFDVMLMVQNVDMAPLSIKGLKWSPYEFETKISKVDITLDAVETDEGVVFGLEYCTKLFKKETMERFSRHFINILRQVTRCPGIRLLEIEIMDEAEKRQILETFNSTDLEFIQHQTVIHRFEKQAAQTPDNIAVVGVEGQHSTDRTHRTNMTYMTYKELNKKSNQLAHELTERGAQPGTVVGLMVGRSIEMIVGILGILKAGGAYLPIDPEYPEERIRYMLVDSGTEVLLKSEIRNPKFDATLRISSLRSTRTNSNDQNLNDQNKRIPTIVLNFAHLNFDIVSDFDIRASNLDPSGLCYIIYTSGSTGRPKGVMVTHQNLAAYIHAFEQEFSIGTTDTMLQQASYSFDAFAEEMYPILLKGGKLAIVPADTVKDIFLLSEFISEHNVTMITCSPLMLNELNKLGPEDALAIRSIHTFISGGDVLKGEYVTNLLKIGKVYNTYGPTETTVCASYYRCAAADILDLPIGKPITGYNIYITDKYSRIVPVGVFGEICITGTGVSWGYSNNPELTAEKFAQDYQDDPDEKIKQKFFGGSRAPRRGEPINGASDVVEYQQRDLNGTSVDRSPLPGGKSPHGRRRHKIYKTGDIGRWLSDGNIQFSGRIDQQINIRGYRIEPGEIENALLKHPDIQEAAITAVKNPVGDETLCAYFVSAKEISTETLRDYLLFELPHYMIPGHFAAINRIPCTASGKLDFEALPEPGTCIGTGAPYAPPTNEIEEKLATLWSEILGLPRISIYDNFFVLGGQSILAMKLISGIKEHFGVRVPLIDFFQKSTIKSIAKTIIELQAPGDQKERERAESNGLIRPFSLDNTPLFRTAVIKLRENRWFFFLDMHHIITDGMSHEIIEREYITLYADGELEEPYLQYRDFSRWQNEFFASKSYRLQETYWLDMYRGEIPGLTLPLDFPRPETRKGEGRTLHLNTGFQLARELKAFAAEKEVTLFMLLLAAYNVLLARTAVQEDIVVGVPVSGRTHPYLASVIGMFVNTLALRNRPKNDLTFQEFLRDVKEITLSALENQDYQFETLVERLNLSGNPGHNPLFDTMFVLQMVYDEEKYLGTGDDHALKMMPYNLENTGALIDLVVDVRVTANDIELFFTYDTSLFKGETVQNMLEHFKNILARVILVPRTKIADIEMSVFPEPIAPTIQEDPGHGLHRRKESLMEAFAQSSYEPLLQEEEIRILKDFNDTAMDFPKDKPIHCLFEEQAAKTPDNVAVVGMGHGTWGRVSLTYRELNRKSSQLARLLIDKGVTPGTIVGIRTPRSPEMMVGILAVLKAGGAYLPIDPGFPPERIRYMLAECNAKLLLTDYKDNIPVGTGGLAPLYLHLVDDSTAHHTQLAPRNSHPATSPENLAYVIYTSGSTGKPKGVMIPHSALINFIYSTYHHYNGRFGPGDNCLSLTSISFDVSVCELFLPLISGSRLVLLPDEESFDIAALSRVLVKESITFTYIPPALLPEICRNLKQTRSQVVLNKLLVGVEPIKDYVLEDYLKLNPSMQIINGYGPTEATICATMYSYQSRPACGEVVPIGKPMANTKILLLDKENHLVPVGVPGELCISGAGVARGYLNNPELSNSKFQIPNYKQITNLKLQITKSPTHLTHPLIHSPIYRTGDLAVWLPDGNIRFLGRIDRQVKIRGYRVEMAEIESALLKHPDIQEAVVKDRVDANNVKYLAAYMVTRKELTVKELRAQLKQKLPDHMIPASFTRLDKMPLTSSGKPDREALPEVHQNIRPQTPYIPPRNDWERQLTEIWSFAIKVEKIGIDDNFFELGGDSLTANRVLARINNFFKSAISIKDFFEAPTIRTLAGILANTRRYPTAATKENDYKRIQPEEKQEYYPTSSPQKRLYILNRLNSEDISYNLPMGMIIEGEPDETKLNRAVKKLVQRHESLRTSFEMQEGEIIQKINNIPDLKVDFFEIDPVPGEIESRDKDEGDSDIMLDAIDKIVKGEISLRRIEKTEDDFSFASVKLKKRDRTKEEIKL